MIARRSLIIFLLLAVACGGKRATHESYAAANRATLLAEAAPLHAKYGSRFGNDIPAAEWPPSFIPLEPKRVQADRHGIYIVTHQRFVESAGIFLRFDHAFMPPAGGDPRYEPIDLGVYWFEIRG